MTIPAPLTQPVGLASAPPSGAGATPKSKHSGYARAPLDYYVEPAWCTELLADQVELREVWEYY